MGFDQKEKSMPEKTPQTLANYTRLDPPFHFFALPVAGITLFVAIWYVIKNPGFYAVWLVIAAAAAIVLTVKIRTYALKLQDRVIRLEERVRLATLLPESLRSRIGALSESQLIALRFASDAEVPGLVEKTLSGKLAGAEIKKAIVNWRPDYSRV
jgi:Family of unknown function (DUF6526)